MFPIRTLLLSGENNHDWQRTTPYCKRLLEQSGRFTVDVTLEAEAALSDAEALQGYQLLFTDYNGPAWGEIAQLNMVKAIEEGAGLVVLHAANNAFPDWEVYKQLLGVTFQEGISGHGDYHEFGVELVDREHPITRTIDDFSTWDELYHRTVPAAGASFTVLAQAYSSLDKGGSGSYEPLVVVRDFGRGRVFHLLLGHVWPHDFDNGYKGYQMTALENPVFGKLLVRGAEWAAVGSIMEE